MLLTSFVNSGMYDAGVHSRAASTRLPGPLLPPSLLTLVARANQLQRAPTPARAASEKDRSVMAEWS
jgi:hypothetical protein